MASVTPAMEDYLEAVFVLSQDGPVRVTDLAERLHIAKPSVHAAMHNLKDSGFVIQEHYGHILLTPEGTARAEQIIRKHRVIKHFLETSLKVPPAQAETEACSIEHFLSAETVESLARFIGYKE